MNKHLRMIRSLPAVFEWNRIHDSAETRLRGHAFLNPAERRLAVVVWCVSIPLDRRNKAPSLSVTNMNVIDPETGRHRLGTTMALHTLQKRRQTSGVPNAAESGLPAEVKRQQ